MKAEKDKRRFISIGVNEEMLEQLKKLSEPYEGNRGMTIRILIRERYKELFGRGEQI